MIILGGSQANGIDAELARHLKCKTAKIEEKVFPDGESYIRIPVSVEGEDVTVVQSSYSPNQGMVELLLTLDTLNDMGASHITVVAPYLSYMRQDKRFLSGEALSIKTMLKLIRVSGAKHLVVVAPHKEETLAAFDGVTTVVNPMDDLAKALAKDVIDPFVLAPDEGALTRAKQVAATLRCNSSFIKKNRDRKTGEVSIIDAPKLDVKGKDVVIVDDMISGGSTVAQASRLAKKSGARSVIAAAVHLLMVRGAYERLMQDGVSKIYGTNTVPFDKAKIIDISATIADALKR